MLLSQDFEGDPAAVGWVYGGGNSLSSTYAHSGTQSLRVQSNYAYSPGFTLTPGSYYVSSFWSLGNTTNAAYGPTFAAKATAIPNTNWTYNQYVFRSGATSGQYLFYPGSSGLYVDDFKLESISHSQAATLKDATWSQIGGGSFSLPADRFTHLSKTIQKLQNGQSLKVVMLGDSIVNDTSWSGFETLIERRYAGSSVNLVASTRSSTGASYYQNVATTTGENGVEVAGVARVQNYVLDYQPDLVMIGGISNNNDIASMKSVIEQIKAGSPTTEILLMSNLAGGITAANTPDALTALDPDGAEWREQLAKLASEEGVAFVDMTQPWVQYISESGQPLTYFQRDNLHMNQNGLELTSRILDAYFAPVPEPGTLGLLGMAAVGMLARQRKV